MYQDMDTERCWRNAAWLVAQLLDKHKLTIDKVVTHRKWSGKGCPSRLLPHWDKFICMVRNEWRQKQGEPRPKRCTSATEIMLHGESICTGTNVNGKVIAPVRPIAEALGAKVGWNRKFACAVVNGNKVVGSKLIEGVAHASVQAITDAVFKPRLDHDKSKGELNIIIK